MKSFDEIAEMVKSKDIDNAEKEIDILIKTLTGKDLVRAYYTKAWINDRYKNDKDSEKKAKKYFGYVIDSDYPNDYAYYRLAVLEKDKEISKKILRKGIDIFPQSLDCYTYLLSYFNNGEKQNLYNEICSKNLFGWGIQEQMFSFYFEHELYQQAIDVYLRNKFDENNIYKDAWELAYSFALLMTGEDKNLSQAKITLEHLINDDIKNILGYKQYMGLSYYYLLNNDNSEAIKYFDIIPSGFVLENYIPPTDVFFALSFTKAFKCIFLKLESCFNKKRLLLIKIKGLKVLFLNGASEFEDIKISQSSIKELENAIKYLPKEKSYYIAICNIATEKKEYLKSLKYQVLFLGNFYDINIDDYISNYYILECDDSIFKEMLFLFKSTIVDNELFLSNICKYLLSEFIDRLWKNDDYTEIRTIASLFAIRDIEKTDCVFEIAFSYAEKKDKNAKILYEFLVANNIGGSAVLNNLSLIYEAENDLPKAYELLKKALELSPKDEYATRNFTRISKTYNLEAAKNIEYDEAFTNFQKEGIFIKQKIMDFSGRMNENNHIICSYKQLPMFMKINDAQAKSLLDEFLEKKYLYKVTNHSYNISSSVYGINPKILNYLPQFKELLKMDIELLEYCKKLSADNLDSIGYNTNLIQCIDKIKTPELAQMLKRDLKENALTCLLNQNKSSIILSGSILESILLDKIKSENIEKATTESGKTKKIIDMDLNELLFIAKQNNIIRLEIYHFSNAVRIYRNLIHPGVEFKKMINGVSAENAELMWDILKRVLIDI